MSGDSASAIRLTLDFRELRWLKYFLVLANAGHLGRAASQLGLTPSALSQHLAVFERELGAKLFTRHSRGVSLTYLGAQLRRRLEVVTPILTAPLIGGYAGCQVFEEVRVGVPSEYCALLMPRFVSEVFRAKTAQRFEVTELSSSDIEEALIARSVDLAFIPNLSNSAELCFEPIAREELGLVCAPASAEAAEFRPLRLRELGGLSMILPSQRHPFSRALAKACLEHNVQLNPLYQTDSFVLRKELVRQWQSFTILPQSAVREELARGALAYRSIVAPRIWTNLALACCPHEPPSPGSELLGAVRAWIAPLAGEGEWPGAFPLPSG